MPINSDNTMKIVVALQMMHDVAAEFHSKGYICFDTNGDFQELFTMCMEKLRMRDLDIVTFNVVCDDSNNPPTSSEGPPIVHVAWTDTHCCSGIHRVWRSPT